MDCCTDKTILLRDIASLDSNNSKLFSDYYEVKAEKERFAAKIKEVVENLRSRYLGQSYICPNGKN